MIFLVFLSEFIKCYKSIRYDFAKKKQKSKTNMDLIHLHIFLYVYVLYIYKRVDICLTCNVKWIQVKVGTKIYRVIFHRCTQINQIGELITAGTF